jgi:hypothetical protein
MQDKLNSVHVSIEKAICLLNWALKLERWESLKLFYSQQDRAVFLFMKVGSSLLSILLILFKKTYHLGIQKHDSLSKFFDSVLSGTADLSAVLAEVKAEELVIDEAELEIEEKQEAQKIALMHGGFASFIDFEKALKDEAGRNFHGSSGYSGIIGGIPEHLKKKPSDVPASEPEELTGTTPVQKEAEAEPIVESAFDEEQIPEQVILEVTKNRDAEASPMGCHDAPSQPGKDGLESTCTRPKDEL